MNRSKSPPVNLEKYLEGKRHRFCTYAQGARLYAMAYWSFVTMAKQAGANIKLRKTALVDLDILDDYIEKNATKKERMKKWEDANLLKTWMNWSKKAKRSM